VFNGTVYQLGTIFCCQSKIKSNYVCHQHAGSVMSVDSIGSDGCGPQPIVCGEAAEKQPVDGEDLLKVLEEQNK